MSRNGHFVLSPEFRLTIWFNCQKNQIFIVLKFRSFYVIWTIQKLVPSISDHFQKIHFSEIPFLWPDQDSITSKICHKGVETISDFFNSVSYVKRINLMPWKSWFDEFNQFTFLDLVTIFRNLLFGWRNQYRQSFFGPNYPRNLHNNYQL